MKIKFTLIDYIIIALVICAIAFAFIHITTDDSSDLQKTAFDESTLNKIPDTYSKYYKDGYIVKAVVEGFNSTNGNQTTLNGTVVWVDDNSGNGVKLLIQSNNETYLTGLYKVKPQEIASLKDLTSKIPDDTNYELTTVMSLDPISSKDLQKITNNLSSHDKRESIKGNEFNQLIIKKATKSNLNDADSILGNINGISDDITIRIYDCTDQQINEISKNFEVTNIRNF